MSTIGFAASPGTLVDPTKKGRDPVTISGVRLDVDKRTVIVTIPDLKPVMQQGITMKFADMTGEMVKFTLYQTVNVVP